MRKQITNNTKHSKYKDTHYWKYKHIFLHIQQGRGAREKWPLYFVLISRTSYTDLDKIRPFPVIVSRRWLRRRDVHSAVVFVLFQFQHNLTAVSTDSTVNNMRDTEIILCVWELRIGAGARRSVSRPAGDVFRQDFSYLTETPWSTPVTLILSSRARRLHDQDELVLHAVCVA